jgi:hypothetical protein
MTKLEALEKEVLDGNTLEQYEAIHQNGQAVIMTGYCLLHCHLKNKHNTVVSWLKI